MTMKSTSFYLFAIYSLVIFFLSNPSECRTPSVHSDDPERLADLRKADVEILFLANLNSNIENCHCGNPSLGGLPQIFTLINEKRVNNPDILVIDGGDFLNSYPFEALNRTTVEIYRLLNPDYFILGDQEFYESATFTRDIINGFADKIVASNYKVSGISLNPALRLQSSENPPVSLMSFLDQEAFIYRAKPEMLHFDQALFDEIYQQLPEEDFTIALFHGPKRQLDWFRETYSQIDLILFGHEQSYLSDLGRKPAVIGGGSDGEHIIHIKVYYGPGGYEYKSKAIPVTLQIEADTQINGIIERFKSHVKKQFD
jgi:2',3'-cyclic-nucleotide 2'-phosphodiesterase (5'-nucleotidase family)